MDNAPLPAILSGKDPVVGLAPCCILARRVLAKGCASQSCLCQNANQWMTSYHTYYQARDGFKSDPDTGCMPLQQA